MPQMTIWMAFTVIVVFRAREEVEMPPPGDVRPARLTVDMRDLVWDGLYAPVANGVWIAPVGDVAGYVNNQRASRRAGK